MDCDMIVNHRKRGADEEVPLGDDDVGTSSNNSNKRHQVQVTRGDIPDQMDRNEVAPPDPSVVFSRHLPPDQVRLFDELMTSIGAVGENEEDEAVQNVLFSSLQQVLTENPILAFTYSTDDGRHLLRAVLEDIEPSRKTSEIVKFLIEANPHAMTVVSPWPWHQIENDRTTLRLITRYHTELMPWIAENYTWALYDSRANLLCSSDEDGQYHSPLLYVAKSYRMGRMGAADLKRFYKHFPAALSQESFYFFDGYDRDDSEPNAINTVVGFPLQEIILRSFWDDELWSHETEELIEFLVELDPTVLDNESVDTLALIPGGNPLHYLTWIIGVLEDRLHNRLTVLERPMYLQKVSKIRSACRLAHLFVSSSPDIVCKESINGHHPLDYLVSHLNRSEIQDLIVFMLRHLATYEDFRPRSLSHSPFCGAIFELAEEEYAVYEEIFNLRTAMGSSQQQSPLTGDGKNCFDTAGAHTGQIYKIWVEDRLKIKFGSLGRVQDIRNRIEDAKRRQRELAGDDHDHR